MKMMFELLELKNNIVDKIDIDVSYDFSKEQLEGTDIRKLDNVKINGYINKNLLGEYMLNLSVDGEMILPCARTLKDVIYPIMKEAALFWDRYLWTSGYQVINDETSPYNGENRLVVAPSFSEEQGPTAVGTTYDQSLVWELYKECIEAGEIVGEDPAVLAQWKENMQKLDPIEINATNGIKEWYEETRVGTESGHYKSYAQAGEWAEIPVPNSGWNIGHPGE